MYSTQQYRYLDIITVARNLQVDNNKLFVIETLNS